MFTGIITDIGTVRTVEQRGDTRLVIGCGYDLTSVDIGASIACSGVCLTVVAKDADWFAVDASAETLGLTAPQMWIAGARLNLERALKVGDELGGHIVTGHVDAIGRVVGVCADGDSRRVGIAVPQAIAPFIARKGSVTIDGVSLTVNDVADQDSGGAHFAINMIPHTAAVTTLGTLAEGDAVNVEIDVLARYLMRMRQALPTAM